MDNLHRCLWICGKSCGRCEVCDGEIVLIQGNYSRVRCVGRVSPQVSTMDLTSVTAVV